jgi:hypothetical protein
MTWTGTKPITWPSGAMTMKVTLPKRPVHPDACGVERSSGRDISWGFFVS